LFVEFIGTRGVGRVLPSQALLRGIAEDGGLYVPEAFPVRSDFIAQMYSLSYNEIAVNILKLFFTDFTETELEECVNKAYDTTSPDAKFDTPEIAPLKEAAGYFFLELFRGKTLAFKDIALSVLPYLMNLAAKKTGLDKKIIILTATSGDTGKAALEAFAGTDGISIAVFYPNDGVSKIQKLQMVTQEGENTFAAGLTGNFDDAQTGVKRLFLSKETNAEIAEMGYVFSSANSINIGRLLPQIVYYFWAYANMVNRGFAERGEKINFTVPTGNFGNILAGYYALKMGLPINKLICASNENKILSDFFNSGTYDANRDFFCTISPSMDILISSNLERLLFDLSDSDSVKNVMDALARNKKYEFSYKTSAIEGVFASSAEALDAIGEMYKKGYVMDTHTAVGFAAYNKYRLTSGDLSKNVILATASPFKFAGDVLKGMGKSEKGFEAVRKLSEYSGIKIPAVIDGLEKKEIRHKTVCRTQEMENVILDFLKKQR